MVASSLNESLIESGKSLVGQLDSSNAKVDAAFWFLFPDEGFWKLMIALDDVEKEGPRAAYAKIQKALARMTGPKELSLDDIALLKPTAPLLKLLRTVLRTRQGTSGVRFTNNAINGHLISDAYVYRLH